MLTKGVPKWETEYFVHTALMTLSLLTSFSVFNMSYICVSGGLKSCCWAFVACADLGRFYNPVAAVAVVNHYFVFLNKAIFHFVYPFIG